MVDAAVRPTAAPTPEAGIDVARVNELLMGTWAHTRREARELIKDPAFWRIDGQSMAEHRERADQETSEAAPTIAAQ